MSINAKNTQDESLHPDPIGNSNMSLTKETISIEEISVEQTDVSNNAQDTDVNLDEEVKTQEDTKSDIELGPLNIELEPSRASQEPEKEDVSNEHERSQEQPVKNENENLQPPLQRKLSEPKLKQETEAQIKLKQETQRRAINLKNTRDMVENIRLDKTRLEVMSQQDNTKNNMKQTNEAFRKTAGLTTMHGCSYLIGQSKVKMTIWLIVILTMLAVCIYYLTERIESYLDYDTSVSITKHYTQNKTLEMPAITVCNHNRYFYNPYKLKNDYDKIVDNFVKETGLNLKNLIDDATDDSWITPAVNVANISSLWTSLGGKPENLPFFKSTLKSHFEEIETYRELLINEVNAIDNNSGPSEILRSIKASQYLDEQMNPWARESDDTTTESFSQEISGVESWDVYNYNQRKPFVEELPSTDSNRFKISSIDINTGNMTSSNAKTGVSYSSVDAYGGKTELKKLYPSLTVSDMLNKFGWRKTRNSLLFLSFESSKTLPTGKIYQHVTPKGVCLTYNYESDQSRVGEGNGIKMAININQEAYTELIMESIDPNTVETAYLNPTAGVSVYVYPRFMKYPDFSNPIEIPPGYKANIALEKRIYKYMHSPYGQCDEESLDYENYSEKECLYACFIGKVFDACGCIPAYAKTVESYRTDDEYKNAPECTMEQAFESSCSSVIIDTKDNLNKEHCSCYEPCKETRFDTKTTYSKFPSLQLANDFTNYYVRDDVNDFLWNSDFKVGPSDNKTTFDRTINLNNNILMLELFYDDLKVVETIEDQADDVASLISDFGGQFGLWMGISILTIVELLYYCFYKLPKGCVQDFGCCGCQGNEDYGVSS